MISRTLDIPTGDVKLVSRYCVADSEPGHPCVLVFPGAGGVSEHFYGLAMELAERGYAALACDIHGDALQVPRDMSVAKPIIQKLMSNVQIIRARGQASLDALRAQPEVDPSRAGAIGYCLGGAFALELARHGADLDAAIGVHTPVATPDPSDAKNIKAKILVINGADDPTVTKEQEIAFEKEMSTAGVDWQMHRYGGVVHSFSIPDAGAFGDSITSRYDPIAAARSWRSSLALLQEVFEDQPTTTVAA